MKDLNEMDEDEGVSEESTSLFTIFICIILFFMGMLMTGFDTEPDPPGKVF
tara:strand:- start:143 stop:295 length:153 start_codon:yes stop_codon:yes gene_type:complete